jgi:hypothetical protein
MFHFFFDNHETTTITLITLFINATFQSFNFYYFILFLIKIFFSIICSIYISTYFFSTVNVASTETTTAVSIHYPASTETTNLNSNLCGCRFYFSIFNFSFKYCCANIIFNDYNKQKQNIQLILINNNSKKDLMLTADSYIKVQICFVHVFIYFFCSNDLILLLKKV